MTIEAFDKRFKEIAGFSCESSLLDRGYRLEVMAEHDGRFFVVGLNRRDRTPLELSPMEIEDLAPRAADALKLRFKSHDERKARGG